jgi:hypothetical protein
MVGGLNYKVTFRFGKVLQILRTTNTVTGQGAGWGPAKRRRHRRIKGTVRICDCNSCSSATCASASADTAELLFAQPIRLYSRRDQEEGRVYGKVTGYGSRERRSPSNDRRTKYVCLDFGHFKGFLALLVPILGRFGYRPVRSGLTNVSTFLYS